VPLYVIIADGRCGVSAKKYFVNEITSLSVPGTRC